MERKEREIERNYRQSQEITEEIILRISESATYFRFLIFTFDIQIS